MTRRSRMALVFSLVGLVATAGAASADATLYYDEDGSLWFKPSPGSAVEVDPDLDVALNGRVMINCEDSPLQKVENSRGETARCAAGYIEVEDFMGNVLRVYPTWAKAEDSMGREYRVRLGEVSVAVGPTGEGGEVEVETDEGTASMASVAGGLVVESGSEKITIGPSGVVMQSGGQTGSVTGGPGGVVVESGGGTVSVGGGYVRLQSGDEVGEVSADWRSVKVSYGDTDELLIELKAKSEGDRIHVDLAGDVLFAFDSTVIRTDAEAVLSKVAQVIRDRAVGKVTVIGHTDSIGSDAYNQKLSQARAVAVMRWLNGNEGIPSSLMVGQGKGSREPVAPNTFSGGRDFPDGRAQNRRVEIQIATRG